MARGRYPFRNDKSAGGRIKFMNTRVAFCDDGIDNLRHYAPVDQGDWTKQNATGEGSYKKALEPISSRVPDILTAKVLDTGHSVLSIFRRFRLPRDFGSFPTLALSVWTYRSGTLDELSLDILEGGGAILSFDVNPAANVTWQNFLLEMGSSPDYVPGAFFTFEFRIDATSIGDYGYLADVSLAYLTARGNT